MRREALVASALALLAIHAVPPARAQGAQDYPARQVTFVLPFAPGGAIDLFARSLAQKLSDKLGKPFVVENRPGAGTVLAAHSVARAAPDGYTVLVSPSPLAINATLYKKLPYDTANDFVAVAYVADIPLVLVVHPSLPVQSIPDLIKYAKDNPGKLSYASSGTGTTLHLSGELLKSITGIQMTHVPYKGGPPALNDVVAGHVQLIFADPASAIQQIRAGRVRPLGVCWPESADRRRGRSGLRGRVLDRVHGARQDARGRHRPAARRADGAGGDTGDARADHQTRHGSRHIAVTCRVAELSAAGDRALGQAGASGRHRRVGIAAIHRQNGTNRLSSACKDSGGTFRSLTRPR